MQARSQTLKQHAATRQHRDSSQAALRAAEAATIQAVFSPCARIYSQHTYTLSNFPYAEATMAWRAAAPTRGRYGSKN